MTALSPEGKEVGSRLELPWGYDGEETVASQDWDNDGYSVFPIDKNGECIGHVAEVADEEKAAFIVRACNSHEALVKALEAARRQIVTLGGDPRKFIADDGSIEGDEIQAAILDGIDAALSLAKGETT